jgi:hypothetical protein
MDEKTKKLIEERIKLLPQDIQAVVLEGSWLGALEDIRKKHGLRVDQAGELQTETFLVLLGLTKPANYVHEIQSRLSVVATKAEEIAQDAELSIFRPILARLEEIYTKENEDTLTQNETTLLKKTGIELENGAPSENIKQESVATEQINRDTLLEEVENPLLIPQQPKTNLVQTKLTETFTIPKTTTTTTPTPPIQKSVDPYREPIA